MQKIDWTTSLFLFLTPLLSAILIPIYIHNESWHWSLLLQFTLFWALTEVAITAGYHRYLAHRSYEARWWVKLFFLYFGAAAFQGSALKWATDHRRHHRFVDTDKDPYNIKKGFWHAHIGWLLKDTPDEYKNKFVPDLEHDSLINFQHRYYVPIAIVTGFGTPLLLGWLIGSPFGGLLFGGLLRIVVAHHCTFFINSLCHTLGSQPYNDTHSARDSFLMAVLTFGEGYHNFHHEFQIDYRNGVRWYQWDPTKWFIQLGAVFGGTIKLKRVSQDAIIRAVVLQDEKILKARGLEPKRIEELRLKVFQAQENLKLLRQDWLQFKNEFKKNSHDKFLQLKAELRITHLEFRMAYAQWKAYVKTLSAQPAPAMIRRR